MERRMDLKGQTFGRLVVIGEDQPRPRVGHSPRRYWLCQCQCGRVKSVETGNLRKRTRSCGCLAREQARARETTHGGRNKPEYAVWCGIKNRCLNPNQKSYRDYGKRGITICERWANSFEHFYADMGARPSADHSIERKDNDGPYSPENCCWALRSTQARNRRTVRFVAAWGRTQTLAEWERETGISHQAVSSRLKAGWSPELALSVPVMKRGAK